MNNTIFRKGDEVEIIKCTDCRLTGYVGLISNIDESKFSIVGLSGYLFKGACIKLISCKIENDADKMRALLGGLVLICDNIHKYKISESGRLNFFHTSNKKWVESNGTFLWDDDYICKVYKQPTQNDTLKKEMKELQETIDKAQKRCEEINEKLDD